MKQSLIITVLLCLALGQSFSVISKKEKGEQKAPSYCCTKSCSKAARQVKTGTESEAYMPMVNILGYN